MASSLFSFLLLSTINFSHNFGVCNWCPSGLLVKFKLWNLTIFEISIVFQRLSGKLPLFVFVFAQKLTRISLEIVLVPGLSGNTKLAHDYWKYKVWNIFTFYFDKLQSNVSQWWKFHSDRTRIKSLLRRLKNKVIVTEKLRRNTLN